MRLGAETTGVLAGALAPASPSRPDSLYLDDIMATLGSLLDIGVSVCGCGGDVLADAYIVSGVAYELERQNPVFVAGKSALELLGIILPYTGETRELPVACYRPIPTPDYWLGWSIAHFQVATSLTYQACAPFKCTSSATATSPTPGPETSCGWHGPSDARSRTSSRHRAARVNAKRRRASVSPAALSN